MDKFIVQDMSCKTKTYELLPEEFFSGAAPFMLSYGETICQVYDSCVSCGFYSPQSCQWQLERVRILDSNDAEVIRPSCEQQWATLFNQILHFNSQSSGANLLASLFTWHSHEFNLVEGQCKPDIILVSKTRQHSSSVDFSSIMTYCEIKNSFKDCSSVDAAAALQLVAGYVTASQINRCFFLGSFMCGSLLFLILYARGNTVYSKAIEVNDDPKLFIKTIAAMSFGLSHHLGYDETFQLVDGAYRIHLESLGGSLKILPQTYYRGFCLRGRGTKVPLCELKQTFYVLKDTWLIQPGPNDVDNHRLYVERTPRQMSPREAQLFGTTDLLGIFRGNKETRGTRQWGETTYLRGIPVLVTADAVRIRYNGTTLEDDTTLGILQRFSRWKDIEEYESRTHYRTLSETCGVSLAWFSCRREFLNGMMCAVAGHFNGLLKDLLHCDPSEGNIWWSIDNPLDVHDVIPDWPADAAKYTKRPAVLGDWGLAEDRRLGGPIQGGLTGTYPFLAAELLSDRGLRGHVCHETWHDLEALFWVIWIVCVNSVGPYSQQRKWQDYEKAASEREASPTEIPDQAGAVDSIMNCLPGGSHNPVDTTHKGIPVWATPGLDEMSPRDVFRFKRDIPIDSFLESMSPYWSEGKVGEVFKEGMRKLRGFFVWPSSDGPLQEHLTHVKFVEILGHMRDSIPAEEDQPTRKEIAEARARYQEMIQLGGNMGASLLEAPETPMLSRHISSWSSASKTADLPTASRLTSNKRRAEALCTRSSSKRPRTRGLHEDQERFQQQTLSREREERTSQPAATTAPPDNGTAFNPWDRWNTAGSSPNKSSRLRSSVKSD